MSHLESKSTVMTNNNSPFLNHSSQVYLSDKRKGTIDTQRESFHQGRW